VKGLGLQKGGENLSVRKVNLIINIQQIRGGPIIWG